MDANNRESAADASRPMSAGDTASRVKRTISDKAEDAKESLNELGRKASDTLRSSRHTTANALDRTASTLHSGADQFSDYAHSAADRLQDTADYFRESDIESIFQDLRDVVRRYPGRSLAVAAVLGFLITRGLRRIGS
jgi:ElaB/YqjD/DUF883 family membrane-anchored ribosome-binding protein